jgi:hypothetical protein
MRFSLKPVVSILVLFATILLGIDVPTSSPGASTLAEIESKARQISQNEERIAEMTRLMNESIEQERQKLAQMSSEVFNLETNRVSELANRLSDKRAELENSTLWTNRRNSAQSGWREHNPGTCGAGGPPPICPVDHWYRVSTSEAMQEYNRMLQEELNKFRNQIESQYNADLTSKKNALQQFQYGENEFVRRRNDWDRQINNLRNQNDQLRQDITRLSQVYKDKVVQGAEAMTLPWARNLMGLVAEKHFFELRIDIAKVRLQDLQVELSEAVSKAREKVMEEENAKIEKNNQRVFQLNTELTTIDNTYNERRNYLNGIRYPINSRYTEVRGMLMNRNLRTSDEITSLESEERDLNRRLSEIDNEINKLEVDSQARRKANRDEIVRLDQESFQIRMNISTKQSTAEEQVKRAFSTRDKILNDAIAARVTSLQNNDRLTKQRMNEYNDYMLRYDRVLEGERNRLLTACRTAGASCYGHDTGSAVATIWNNSSSCVQAMENKRNMGTYYGCDREAPLYQQAYNGHINGLSDSDIQAAQRSSTRTRFNSILDTIN